MPTTWGALIELANRLEPRLARAYLAAIARLRERTDSNAIAQAISEGRPYFITAAQLPLFEQALDPVLAVLTDALHQAWQQTADRFTDPLGVAMRFDLTNPLAIEVARQTAAGMVTNISAETRLAIQNVISRAIEEGFSYRDAAMLIRSIIGLTSQASQAVMNYRRALLEIGLKRATVDAQVARYAAKKLRERAVTISRTELMKASNAGQVAAWRQAAEMGLIPNDSEREWLATIGDTVTVKNKATGKTTTKRRTCDQCRAMHKTRVSLWASFPGGNPPRHPNCRCTEILVVAAAGARRRAA